MQPLAERLRPKTLDDYIGQKHLVGPGAILRKMIDAGRISSFILWGPPGVGKTTLAQIIANKLETPFYTLSAVTSGVKDVREVIDRGAAGVHFDELGVVGDKLFLFVRCRIIKIHVISSCNYSSVLCSSASRRILSISISIIIGSGVWIWSSFSPQILVILPGTPTTVAFSGTSRSTTEFAAIRAARPRQTRNVRF